MRRARSFVLRTIRLVLMPAVFAAAFAGLTPITASASTCVSLVGNPPVSPGTSTDVLSGVTVLSPCRAWAVGYYNVGLTSQTLIERWNGTSWTQQTSPNPGGPSMENVLSSVAAASPTDVWAVGSYGNGSPVQSLIEHWNGTAWTQQTSPNPATVTSLTAVAAISSTNAWAVGNYQTATGYANLILHWNGTAWKRVKSPEPPGGSQLSGVAATSSKDVWAVGAYFTGTAYQTLILHWNGAGWKRVKSPNVGGSANSNSLLAVSAVSATNAWAVGFYANGSYAQTLALRWNGTAWKRVPTPDPGGASRDDLLEDVATVSAKNAWAVGYFVDPTNTQTLLLHWNGKAWRRVKSPNPGGDAYTNIFWGVDGASATDLWMVGSHSNGVIGEAMAVHCC